MGRKPIPTNKRAQPISFSLKPHLIEKIDDYANDLRFSRSKFLQEAVTQYILKTEMGYMAASNNVNDMTLAQKVAVGLAALQEANREGETISKAVMDALRRELRTAGQATEAAERQAIRDVAIITGEDLTSTYTVEWEKQGNTYVGFIDGKKVSTIRKMRSKWVTQISGQMVSYKTLKEAKQDVQDFYVNRGA